MNWLMPTLIASQLAVSSAIGGAQKTREPYTISDNVDLVLLDVSVKNPHGGFVSGLEKANFQVFEDGTQEKLRISPALIRQ